MTFSLLAAAALATSALGPLWGDTCDEAPVVRTVLRAFSAAGPRLVAYRSCARPAEACFAMPHENEQTAFQTALAWLHKNGGTLLRVEQSGNREVIFAGPQRCTVDPNRFFSDEGLRKNLAKLNGAAATPQLQFASIRAFADAFRSEMLSCVSKLPQPVVVALHNNRHISLGDDYSIRSYLPGGDSRAEAAAREGNPAVIDPGSPDNFFLVTSAVDFEALRAHYNVVLQAQSPTDDGSLSTQLPGYRYINLEVVHGDHAGNARMLEFLMTALRTKGAKAAPR
jgi:hypothetical protein